MGLRYRAGGPTLAEVLPMSTATPPNTGQTEPVPTPTPDIDTFRRLVARWKEDTEFLSSTTKMTAHPAYQEIIRMGPAAVPLILEELRRECDHWFTALRTITGENPVPAEDRGKVERMREAWLRWAEAKGIEPVP